MKNIAGWSVAALVLCGCGSNTKPAPAPETVSPPSPVQPAEKLIEKAPEREAPVETVPQPKSKSERSTSPTSPTHKLLSGLARKEGAKWIIDSDAQADLDQLGRAGQDEILPLLNDANTDVRRGAAYYLLGRFDPGREELVAAYLSLLEDEDRTIRGLALSAMEKLRPEQREATAARIAKLLADSSVEEQHRATAARLLSQAGKQASAVLPGLTAAAKEDESAAVRKAALDTLSRIAQPTEVLPALRDGLSDSDRSVRTVALQRLKALGPDAAPASAELGKLLEDQEEKTRIAAAETLVRIGKPSVPIFAAALDSKSRDTRELAVFALGKLGSLAKPAIPALQKRLSDEDPKVNEQAKAVLDQLE